MEEPVVVAAELLGTEPMVLGPEHLRLLGDDLRLRDARGRSRRPALLAEALPDGGTALIARGPFTVLQRFRVDPRQGEAFARASRDENPLHTEGAVVPGAMLAARALLLPEILVPRLSVRRVRLRFRAFALYGIPTVNLYRFEACAGGEVRIGLAIRQREREVAAGEMHAAIDPPGSSVTAPRRAPARAPAAVREFLRSLDVDPAGYLRLAGESYPRAFLASLPSGEMVRRFSGDGGLLNALELEFPETAQAAGHSLPSVEIEEGARSRLSFRKVFARIAFGMRTFCSGFALVLPRQAAAAPVTSPGGGSAG